MHSMNRLIKKKKTITDPNAFNEQINKEETDINIQPFKKHFKFQRPSDMLKSLYKVNTNQNNELLSVINSGLKDFKKLRRCLKKKEKLKSQIIQ